MIIHMLSVTVNQWQSECAGSDVVVHMINDV